MEQSPAQYESFVKEENAFCSQDARMGKNHAQSRDLAYHVYPVKRIHTLAVADPQL